MLPAFALAAALATTAPRAPGPAQCPSAAALFRDVRAHTGGARWDAVRELVGEGVVQSSGLQGRTRIAIDMSRGATSIDDDQGIVRTRLVSSPETTWEEDLTHGVHRLDAPDARAAARTSAYLARNGYFHPSTDPASFACLADGRQDGVPLRRVRVSPRGGRPVIVWIDPVAHVVVRTQQQAPMYVATTDYGAYRSSAGLLLPHEITESFAGAEDIVVRSIETYRARAAITAADFARPSDPSNQRITDGAASTEVPLQSENGVAVVEAYVDGHGPLPFVLDTGGHAILTATAAKQLGLTARGGGVSGGAGEGTMAQQYAQVHSLRIGGAQITDFPMFVIPYGKDFTDRGAGRPPLAGILGLEVFERFAVTMDYRRHTLRLRNFRSFTPPARDVAVPLYFQEDMPLAYAEADGVRGLFGVDTGNSGRIFLFGDFLKHHGFFERYAGGAEGQSGSSGGIVRSSTYRLHEFTFGGLTMHEFVTGFVVQQKGSFSSRTEAGNFGYDVLSQFTLTTDYRRGRIYLHREPGAPLPQFTRTGFVGGSRDAQNRLVVGAVLPNSPATEAGLARGDVILTIDGVPTQDLTPPELAGLARRPAGTPMRLTVRRGDTDREVTLIRRDLLCNRNATRCAPWVSPAR
jgi:PDZ domain/Aspartyl protease